MLCKAKMPISNFFIPRITVATCKRCHIQCIVLHDWSYYTPIGVFIREGLLALLAGIPTWIITFHLAEIPLTVSLPFPSSSCSSLTLRNKNVSAVNPVKLFLETSESVECYRMKCMHKIWDLWFLIFLHGSHHWIVFFFNQILGGPIGIQQQVVSRQAVTPSSCWIQIQMQWESGECCYYLPQDTMDMMAHYMPVWGTQVINLHNADACPIL